MLQRVGRSLARKVASFGVHCVLRGVCGSCVLLGQIQATGGTCDNASGELSGAGLSWSKYIWTLYGIHHISFYFCDYTNISITPSLVLRMLIFFAIWLVKLYKIWLLQKIIRNIFFDGGSMYNLSWELACIINNKDVLSSKYSSTIKFQ
jgi:hypothetical protein